MTPNPKYPGEIVIFLQFPKTRGKCGSKKPLSIGKDFSMERTDVVRRIRTVDGVSKGWVRR